MSSAIGPQPHSVYGFPADSLRRYADAASPADVHHPHMRRSTYAVWWTEGQGPRHADSSHEVRIFCLLCAGLPAGLIRICRAHPSELLQISAPAAKKYQGFETGVVVSRSDPAHSER